MRVCDYRYNEQLIKIKQLEARQAKTSGGGDDYEDLKALLKSAVEADNGDNKDGNNKFTIRSAGHCSETVQRELTYGLFQDATLGLVDFMDVDETELYRKMSTGISGMREEINTRAADAGEKRAQASGEAAAAQRELEEAQVSGGGEVNAREVQVAQTKEKLQVAEKNLAQALDDKECFEYVADCEAGCDPPEKVFQFGWKRDCDCMTKELLAGLSVCLSVCLSARVCVCVCVYHGIQLV